MYTECCFRQRGLWVVCNVTLVLSAVHVIAQTPERPVISQAEVTGNDIYVRCGASLNHYPVCKLNAGDLVTIVGEMGNWYEILPPEGVFSYISGDYVDTADNRTGVVNGNNVHVRSGSLLPDFDKLKYVVQRQLSKGAEVTILGREADGFLRIRSPAGVTVWVNRAYVELVPDALAAVESEGGDTNPPDAGKTDAVAADTVASAADQPGDDKAEGGADAAEDSSLAEFPPTGKRQELEEIDAAARQVLAKPVVERDFGPLIERYRVITRQEKDEFARRYAQARIDQLTNMGVLTATIRKMRRLDDEVSSKRRGFLAGRAKILETSPPTPSGIDAQGELRVSALYPPGTLPRRYRLVDANIDQERTIAYVQIPPDSTIEVDAFLGRYVGVRASTKRLQAGGVNPVPIYVAGELIALQPPAATAEPTRQE